MIQRILRIITMTKLEYRANYSWWVKCLTMKTHRVSLRLVGCFCNIVIDILMVIFIEPHPAEEVQFDTNIPTIHRVLC